MTARSLGEILANRTPAKQSRANQPVRRDSYYVTDRRASALWKPLGATRRDVRRLIAVRLQAAERYDRHHKQPGKWNGPLGAIGIEVLRELYQMVDFKSGRLDPAIATICARIRRSKQAVVNALKRLKEHGFINWVRRSEPTYCPGAGPQIRQISNAYGFGLPAMAAAWIKRKLGAAPVPDCEQSRLEADGREVEAMLATASVDEQVGYLVDDDGIAAVLKRIGAALPAMSASLPNEKKPYSSIFEGRIWR